VVPGSENQVDFKTDKLGRQGGKSFRLALSVAILDHDIPALDVAELAQSLSEGLVPDGLSRGRSARQDPDASRFHRRLTGGDGRQEDHRAEPNESRARQLLRAFEDPATHDRGLDRHREYRIFGFRYA
jgi:hypothetical protein